MLKTTSAAMRRGITLVEVLVVVVVGGIVLSLVATISVRQQRAFADLADAGALSGQLHDAGAILPIDLRGVAASVGDIRAGEARDTSIELRGTIASAVVCDTTPTLLVLAPAVAGSVAFGSYLTSIEVGDTAWIYAPVDSVDDWRPFRVSSQSNAAPGACADGGPHLGGADRLVTRVAVGLDAPPAFGAVVGMPLRVTRPLRYSLYRASDGAWYLGERDWNTTNLRFNTIQPVSGPFLSASAGGLSLRYLDSTGHALSTPVADTRSIALVRVDVRGQTKDAPRALGAATTTGKRGDSLGVVVLLHNRR